jgi:hypothetical protein
MYYVLGCTEKERLPVRARPDKAGFNLYAQDFVDRYRRLPDVSVDQTVELAIIYSRWASVGCGRHIQATDQGHLQFRQPAFTSMFSVSSGIHRKTLWLEPFCAGPTHGQPGAAVECSRRSAPKMTYLGPLWAGHCRQESASSEARLGTLRPADLSIPTTSSSRG